MDGNGLRHGAALSVATRCVRTGSPPVWAAVSLAPSIGPRVYGLTHGGGPISRASSSSSLDALTAPTAAAAAKAATAPRARLSPRPDLASAQSTPRAIRAPAPIFAVFYDPSAGFVTGGGWINSPPEACQLTAICAGAVGKANFGFNSKYLKGATVPTGQTEFQFQAGNLNFHSTSYQWLVISGSTKAQYKGSGTIDGQTGSFQFLLTANDLDPNPDRFRIKIMNGGEGVVYDNWMSDSTDTNDLNSAPSTVLGGGSIVIHK